MTAVFHRRFEEVLSHLPFAPEIEGERSLAVAVSGGPDSMALCRLLSLWADGQPQELSIMALTVDHGLRPESAEEAAQVSDWVKGWPRVKHKILKTDIKPGQGRLMERARQARYRLMADYCHKAGVKRLFLAHHQDDQMETFLFRLAKGSGLDGLAAMRPVQAYGDMVLLRPLLGMPKDALVSFCQGTGIPFIEDPTNRKMEYARNRLRQAQEVLIREGLTPKRLAATAERLAHAKDALDFYAGKAWANSLIRKTKAEIVLRYSTLAAEPFETGLRTIILASTALRRGSGRDTNYGVRLERMESLAKDLFSNERAFKKRTLGGIIFSHDRKNDLILMELERATP